MQLAAYYYPATPAQKRAGHAGKYELHQLENGARIGIAAVECPDKRTARRWAARDGAKPWNF